ncbi:FkbM family methyltransferase [Cohnella boryungensis]|uniref:FkbM family methyltransferase n=1 Tax=Cohnella boryungensis TaxID=768479 RepID=A0ABV8S9R4_9BACL
MSFHTVYIGNGRLLCRTGYGGKLLLPSDDLSLTPEIALAGDIELPLARYFLNHVRPGHRVLDIGANIGYFSVLLGMLVGPEGKLWAYEPYPELNAFLFDNLSINYLHDRTEVVAKAAYSSQATLAFHASRKFMGNSSLHEPSPAYLRHYRDEFRELRVEAEPLDARAEEFGVIDFAKLDIEGGEYHALVGMEGLLPDRVRHLVFELNRPLLAEDWEPFCSLLRRYRDDYGKRFALLSAEGLPVPIELERLLAKTGYPFALIYD